MLQLQLLSTSAAARRLEVSQNHVRRLIQRGDLQAVRTDLGFLISVDEIKRYLEAHGTKGAGQ